MENLEIKTGIAVNSITFDEHGEMVVLDDAVLDLISGGAAADDPIIINGGCTINVCKPPVKGATIKN